MWTRPQHSALRVQAMPSADPLFRRCVYTSRVRMLAGLGFCMLSNAALAEMRAVEFVAVSESSFAHPHDLTLSPERRYLFVTDMNNDVVKVVDPDTLHTRAD